MMVHGVNAGDERDRWRIEARAGDTGTEGEAYYVYGFDKSSDPEVIRSLAQDAHDRYPLAGRVTHERMPVPIIPTPPWWQRHLDTEPDPEGAFARAQEIRVAKEQTHIPIEPVSGDLCRMIGDFAVEHYRCDDYADSAVTRDLGGKTVVVAPAHPNALIGFERPTTRTAANPG